MDKKSGMELDHMNRNTIISMAMATALWETERKDLISLITPFVLYAIGQTTHVGAIIDVDEVCSVMHTEFGYKHFQGAVVRRVLLRETSSKFSKSQKVIEKKHGQFYLIGSLETQNGEFIKKRTECKGHSDQVISELVNYLNEKRACGRTDYTQPEVERNLLLFIEAQGNSVLTSVDDLCQIRSRDNELAYYIGRFILQEKEKQSVVMDYLVELTKGYFVTTAIFLQAENADLTKSSFKDVTFYLDTRVLLAHLGYKSRHENESIQTMIASLKKNGAKLACFVYNTEEVKSILKAYRNSVLYDDHRTTVTLEYFDEHGRSSTLVEMAQKRFEDNLRSAGIFPTRMDEVLEAAGALDTANGLLNDSRLRELLVKINPKYNMPSLPDDLQAINTVSRIRGGEELPCIERSRAVFVTSNVALVAATKQYLDEERIDPGFPLAITVEDLCVIAWIKDFEQSGKLPEMRLLESVLAAITPSKELLDKYFEWIDILEHESSISADEAALLRVELFARQELMKLTCGNKDRIDGVVIKQIRDKLGAESYEKGHAQGIADAHRKQDEEDRVRRNGICKQAEKEIENKFKKIESGGILAIRILLGLITAMIIAASFMAYRADRTIWCGILTLVSIAGAIETGVTIASKKSGVIRFFSRCLEKRMIIASDKNKEKYLSIFEKSKEV